MGGAQAFHAARDVRLRHRADLDAARAAFRWPVLDRFNWALDHFDLIAADNHRAALRFAAPDKPSSAISFADLASGRTRWRTICARSGCAGTIRFSSSYRLGRTSGWSRWCCARDRAASGQQGDAFVPRRRDERLVAGR